MLTRSFIFLIPIAALFSCNNKKQTSAAPVTEKPSEKKIAISYQLLFPKDSIKKMLKTDTTAIDIIAALNRAD